MVCIICCCRYSSTQLRSSRINNESSFSALRHIPMLPDRLQISVSTKMTIWWAPNGPHYIKRLSDVKDAFGWYTRGSSPFDLKSVDESEGESGGSWKDYQGSIYGLDKVVRWWWYVCFKGLFFGNFPFTDSWERRKGRKMPTSSCPLFPEIRLGHFEIVRRMTGDIDLDRSH